MEKLLVAEMVAKMDPHKVLSYAKQTENQSVVMKVAQLAEMMAGKTAADMVAQSAVTKVAR